jgi:hypothetical protein
MRSPCDLCVGLSFLYVSPNSYNPEVVLFMLVRSGRQRKHRLRELDASFSM